MASSAAAKERGGEAGVICAMCAVNEGMRSMSGFDVSWCFRNFTLFPANTGHYNLSFDDKVKVELVTFVC